MSSLFSPALLACIAEGRDPSSRELAALAVKVRREVYGTAAPRARIDARTIAQAAMAGS